MSRIWAALPLLGPLDPNAPTVPPAARWWRHPTPKNADGYNLLIRTDTTTDYREARLGSWEWFDGLHEQLIFGVDVFGVNHCFDGARSHIDVLALNPPTSSLGWSHLSEPGEGYRHDCGFVVPASAFAGKPYTMAPVQTGAGSVGAFPVDD